MLEQETIQGVMGVKPTGMRKRTSSFPEDNSHTLESVLKQLDVFYFTLLQHGNDGELVRRVIKQHFYMVCCVTLNNLLLRKDMCSWSKGLQIRYPTHFIYVRGFSVSFQCLKHNAFCLSSGIMSVSWRSGCWIKIFRALEHVRVWNLSFRPLNFCRSKRRVRTMPMPSAPCVQRSQHNRCVFARARASLSDSV